MGKIRGVIFDLDGTLLDTLHSLAAAFNQALSEMNCPPHQTNEYKMIIGDGARVAALRCLPDDRQDEASIEDCVRRFQKIYGQSWHENTAPYPGIPELLAALSVLTLPMGVLSNKDADFTEACVEHFFESGTFITAVGFTETIRHKPDPGGALRIARTFSCEPDQVAFVGDTATDMNTAHACNMLAIGVLWGFRDAQELNRSGAQHLVQTPHELRELLEQLI